VTPSGIITVSHAGQTREVPLTGNIITIGRARDNSLIVKGMQVSHHHARVQFTDERVMVTDLGSTNGTRLNGTLIEPMMPTPVKDGDSIAIGDYRLTWNKTLSTVKDTGKRIAVYPSREEENSREEEASRGTEPTQVAGSHKPAIRLKRTESGTVPTVVKSGKKVKLTTSEETTVVSISQAVPPAATILISPSEGLKTVLYTPGPQDDQIDQSMQMMLSKDTQTPRLVIHMPGQTWEYLLNKDLVRIGRDDDNDIVIDHPSVSRHHAHIETHGRAFQIRDDHSTNGICLRGLPVEKYTLLDGDMLQIGRARLVFKAGFTSDDLILAEAGHARRHVVIVPGMMGSELWLGNEKVWPAAKGFLHPELVAMPSQVPIVARGLVQEVIIIPNFIKQEQYGRLGDYLEKGLGYHRNVDLHEFAYDWRQDVRISAQQLANTIPNWCGDKPVTIIAHSLGCLVSRYYIEMLGGKNQVERLVLLGGPHYGVPKIIPTILIGPDLLPLGLLNERLRNFLATFPSVYQIVPSYGCALDENGQSINLLEDVSWLQEERQPLLRAARAFRRELGLRTSVPTISIFGYGLKTTTRMTFHRDRRGKIRKANFLVEENGDGSVPCTSAVLPKTEIHPVQQDHGALYIDDDVKMRLKLELTRSFEQV